MVVAEQDMNGKRSTPVLLLGLASNRAYCGYRDGRYSASQAELRPASTGWRYLIHGRCAVSLTKLQFVTVSLCAKTCCLAGVPPWRSRASLRG